MATASIRVRKKQSIASSGVHTIGSFSLNDVFNTTGTPVEPFELFDHLPVQRCRGAVNGLQAAGAVDMGDRGDDVVFVGRTL